jgi:hypothetical protein
VQFLAAPRWRQHPLTLRLWARRSALVGEGTVLDGSAEVAREPALVAAPSQTLRGGPQHLARNLRQPRRGRWPDKVRPTRLALANTSTRGSGSTRCSPWCPGTGEVAA